MLQFISRLEKFRVLWVDKPRSPWYAR